MKAILVSVVVPTYKRPDFLDRCLGALVSQDFDPYCYEIVIADDGDDPATRAQVERWGFDTKGAPAIRYIAVSETQGPAGARNRGWRAARGEIIAFTDDDTVPRSDWLSEGWKAMRGGATAASGRVVVPLPGGTPTDYERDIARMADAEFVTANCFVRRQALQAIGGFDERFTSAWREDSDLQFTLLKVQGEVIKAPDAVVRHPVRPVDDWTYNLRQHRKVLFDALLFKKHPRLYRERIRRTPPWNYYGIVVSLIAMAAALVAGAFAVAWIAFAAWAILSGLFLAKRLDGTSRAPRHVAEMVVTSLAIPVVAVYWRLVGAFRFRVFFL
jgi:glycosyltransferase involved in cell wall biosynthesis